MRVAFLGNMNNNHFAMARFLRDRGVEADVLLFPHEPPHFHPSADTYDLTYRHYCHEIRWGNPETWGRTSRAAIRKDLDAYDYLIGAGYAPAFCHKADRPLDIFVPYGSDIWNFTRFRVVSPKNQVAVWATTWAQRLGIPRSAIFHMDHSNGLYEGRWEELSAKAGSGMERWWLGLPMVYTGTYAPDRVPALRDRTHWAEAFDRVRAESDILLLSQTRHVWGGRASDPSQKGTDILLRGLALFRKQNPGVRVKLATLEYGSDVHKSKTLIAELGLEDSVQWFPRMYRKDLMVGVLHADIVCAEFTNSWLSSGVIYEALAMGTPILGRRDDRNYEGRYPWLYPLLNASKPEDVARRLEEYAADPDFHRSEGLRGLAWYEEFVVDAVMERYLEYFRRPVRRQGSPS